jgi:hypothetical protein
MVGQGAKGNGIVRFSVIAYSADGIVLAVWLGVTFRAEKMQRDIGLVADNPAVVARADIKEISSAHLVVAAILHSASGAAGHNHADMFHLT